MKFLSSVLENFKSLQYRMALPKTIIRPLSGGTDSAVAFWLLSVGLPKTKTIGVHAGTCLHEKAWFKDFGYIDYVSINNA